MFDKANQECGKVIVEKGLDAEVNKAKESLRIAEEALIAYGISIAPAAVRETLSKGVADNYNIREKMIDMVFRLDTTTVK